MKKLLLCLLSCFLISCGTQVSAETTPTSLQIAVTSDLHYVHRQNRSDAIVPLVRYSDDFTQCLVDEVIDIGADVFIMTGDLTNDGNIEDEQYLADHLKKLKESGVTVILTTGNHDYNQSDAKAFEKYYFPLLTIESRDPNSLSYATVVNHIRFLAMDDGYDTEGEIGSFSKETMKWLKDQLETALHQQEKVIFLSHHSVLFEDHDRYHRYSITNEDLIPLLKKYNVKLILTGHQHGQATMHKDNMYEIISAMPMNGSHLYGTIQVNGDDISYQTHAMNIKKYGTQAFIETVSSLEETSFNKTKEIFVPLFNEQNISAETQDGIFSLFGRFMKYAQEGSLALHYEEIQTDPYLNDMLTALADYNYGPWMESVLRNPPEDASALEFHW